MIPSSNNSGMAEIALQSLAGFIEEQAGEIVRRAERAWESSILLYSDLTDKQREQIRRLGEASVVMWCIRLRQDPGYARRVHELGQEWGEQAAVWELHVYSFTKALELLGRVTWEFLTEHYPMEQLSPAMVFFLGRSRDQVLDDLRVPLLSIYLQRREVEMAETRFSLEGPLTLPGRSLLQELGSRLQANKSRVLPQWTERVERTPGTTTTMVDLLCRRGATLVELLLSLLQSPTPETSAASLTNVQAIGLESATAGVPFDGMFHALQQLRPILWDTVYEIYRREQYWHPAEFIEVLARLHLLLDLFSEGIGQAYLRQKEMIIQDQAEAIRARDLKLARDMLESLLPHGAVTLPQTEIGSVWMPAREIGGDFYDVFTLDDGDAMFLIGDVSGKGISAALLVSMVKYIIKANAPQSRSPAALLRAANRVFFQDTNPEMFVTMFAARYTPSTGRLVYTSAGHDTCYLCRSKGRQSVLELPNQGPILGVLPEIELTDRRLWMQPGDMLLLYTDGLVNVRCAGSMMMTPRHLCDSVRRIENLPAREIAERLVQDVLRGCEATDDITVLVAKRIEQEALDA